MNIPTKAWSGMGPRNCGPPSRSRVTTGAQERVVEWQLPGGIDEEEPAVLVTWTRLDTDDPVVIENGGKATNAFTPEEGWFMIAGIDPDQAGCWKLETGYEGATHSYVHEKAE